METIIPKNTMGKLLEATDKEKTKRTQRPKILHSEELRWDDGKFLIRNKPIRKTAQQHL